jgi:hypothetical protein
MLIAIKMATKENSCTGLFHKTASTKEARITPVQFLMRMKVELPVPLPGDNVMPCKLVNSTNNTASILLSQSSVHTTLRDISMHSLLRNGYKSIPD